MPPKVKPDDLIDALVDPRVIEALAKALAPHITLSIEEFLKTKLKEFESVIKNIKNDVTRLNNKCDIIAKRNDSLKGLVNCQNSPIDDLEAYIHCDNLIIRGLTEHSAAKRATSATALDDRASLMDGHTSVQSTVIDFCKDALGVNVSPGDISIAHRMKACNKDSV